MVVLKNRNEELESQNNTLSNLVKSYEQKYQVVINTSGKKDEEEDNPERKELLKKEWEQNLIKETVSGFVERKKQMGI